MSYHIIQPKRSCQDFINYLPQFSCVFFVSYINRNHKDKKHSCGRRLDTTLYIDQNVSQPVYLEDLDYFFFQKIWRFQLINTDILKSQETLESRLFLYSFFQLAHQQKFFGGLQIYGVFNTGIFILLQTPFLMVICGTQYFCKKYHKCFKKGMTQY